MIGAGELAGTKRLFRLALRRDRVRIPVWAVATAGLLATSGSSISALYTTRQDLIEYAAVVRGNAAMIVQSGPGYGLEDPTLGAILMNEGAVWMIVLVSILGILMTTRHTRLEEETMRAELLRSAPVGRHAGAAAALLAVLVAQVVVAAATASAIIAIGYATAGAVAFAASLVAVGMVFAAITLVTAQVAATARGASGLGLAALGVSFVVRAFGDVSAPWFSWLSPIHWAQAVRAFASERWAVLPVPIVATAALVVLADRLSDRRDFGAGMRAQKVGRPGATRWLTTPLGLAVRLHRGAAVAWGAGVVVLAFFYGVIADQAERMLEDHPELEDLFLAAGGATIVDSFMAMGLLVVGLVAAGYVVSAVLRMRSEEFAGRADPLLATPVGRTRWAGSHLLVATAAAVLLMVLAGLAQGVGAALVLGDTAMIPRMAAAGLTMSVAVVVLGAIAFALCAALPRRATLAWAVLIVTVSIGWLGEALDLPWWSRDLSPFEHVPAMPAVGFDAVPVLALLAVAVGFVGIGLVALPRRDIARA